MNKILFGVIGILVILGAFFLLSNKSKNTAVSKPSPTTQSSASPSAQINANTVTLTANGFSPSMITVKKGDTITFVNKSGSTATVNSDPHPIHTLYPFLNLGNFADGGSLSVTLAQVGTFSYHNHLNPTQKGTIIVQ